MAANNSIVKKSIQIDAGNTVRTVKSLKQEISDLRDELLNLEQGTQEYDDVQKQLQEDVEDLNTVMSAHKDQASVLEGSYLDLQNQLKELKTAWKETNDEAERDVLGQKINDLNNQLKDMDASVGDFHRNVGNYESAWKGLTGVMENGEKITDDLEKGIKAFGTAIGLSDKQVNALSKSLKAMKDGFNIAKDIAKAREETTKLGTAEAQAAVQGKALATSQKATAGAATTMATSEVAAAGATRGLSAAMGGLKAALISTGIGALIVALGALVGALEKAFSKAREARIEAINAASENLASTVKDQINNLEKLSDDREFDRRKMEAAGASELELLEKKKEDLQDLSFWYKKNAEDAEKFYNDEKARVEKLPKKRQEEHTEALDILKKTADEAAEAVDNLDKEILRTEQDIEIQKIKDAHKETEKITEELRKWSDLVKDPKFQTDWKALFEADYGDKSPIEILKAQREAAIALVNQYKGDTKEVEQFFNQMISEAEAEWQSLVEKEQQIFDERLTPAQRLENEKAEWIEKANRWGMDATTIVKYYNDKIAEAEKEAAEKAAADQKEIEDQRLADLNSFLAQVDGMLDTQEKLDEMFNPMYMQDTARGDIDQEVEGLQRLYDAQMEYLNGLLESAGLTEEAYAGIEDRILQLTVTFNNQMKSLKKEQEFQGKNFAILSSKQVANFNLMETAASEFSNAFQSMGMEDSVAYKGFATAQALISAILAANRVLAEEPGEMWIKIAAAAATLTAGLANVASIWAVNPDGSNANSVNPTMSRATPVIGNSQPINYYRNVTEASPEDEMNKYNIIVKVSDIEDGLNERKAQVSNSSF